MNTTSRHNLIAKAGVCNEQPARFPMGYTWIDALGVFKE